ncbi:microfibril-associated glycoprotein 4-like [Ruditapes philippinarum]|uniref:microfibril-associated glycoprotein 4-like n=1 Tax=Ruditapes philippinarum TaxID=129788 RepID=UPI00295A9C87|nr:microfibril-associated glycoprotein 4-like [Ruditapes philippinarum]
MKSKSKIVILISTFLFVLQVISSTIVHWKKYDFIRQSLPLFCKSSEILFSGTVHDPLECSKICSMKHSCLVSSFKPDSHECIGCQEFRIWYVETAPTIKHAIEPQKHLVSLVSDCKEILDEFPEAESGFYEIKLWSSNKTLIVNCDMETDGGGWTIFHRRLDGSIEFYRNFTEYENGFGNAGGELWLGLKYIQELADQSHSELRIDMTNYNNATGYEIFQEFKLTNGIKYTLNIGLRDASVNVAAGLAYSNSVPFTTFDRDLDTVGSRNCAVDRHAGWWHRSCTIVNLNGLYVPPGSICKVAGAEPGQCDHQHGGFDGGGEVKLRRSSMMLRRT